MSVINAELSERRRLFNETEVSKDGPDVVFPFIVDLHNIMMALVYDQNYRGLETFSAEILRKTVEIDRYIGFMLNVAGNKIGPDKVALYVSVINQLTAIYQTTNSHIVRLHTLFRV